MPFPPAAAGTLFILAHIRRTARPVIRDLLQNLVKLFFKPVGPPIPPAVAQIFTSPVEMQPPMWEIFDRDDRGIVGPMFEQRPVFFQRRGEVLGSVRLAPGIKDHVMRTRNRVDAIDLNKAEPLDQSA